MADGLIVVTGGTGALGGVVVARLLAAGYSVAVPYRGENAFSDLRTAHPGAPLWGAAGDAADPVAMSAFVEEAIHRLGRLSGLAALAGAYAGAGRLDEAPPAQWDEMQRLNLGTAQATCRAVLPRLRETGGSIVTVASRLLEGGGAGAAAYAVAKAGVVALTRAIAAENAAAGIRANCILPGIIDTPENRAAMAGADTASWTEPLAIADLVSFLFSPESRALSGALLPLIGAPKAV